MDFPFSAVGNVLGSVGDFIGGAMARNQQNQQFQQSAQLAQQQFQFQMDAAKQGIQWRVADAKAAGISPLVALGAPTFNPGAIGLSGGGVPPSTTDMAGALGRAGQDISNSVGRTMTQEQRLQYAQQMAIGAAQLEKIKADTDVSRATAASVLARTAQSENTPAFPSIAGSRFMPGQAEQYGSVKYDPSKITSAQPTAPSVEAGTPKPSVEWRRLPNGDIEAAPTSPGAIANPSFLNPEYVSFFLRNRLFPGEKPPESMLPPSHVRFQWFNGAWRPTMYWPGERITRYRGGQ